MPDEPEALGLLALMLFHDARSAATGRRLRATSLCSKRRTAPVGCRGHRRRLRGARRRGAARAPWTVPGPGRHRGLPRAAGRGDRLVAKIAALYDLCFEMAPSPVIELNRAVAVSMSEGPEAGLALVDAPRRRTVRCAATTSCRRRGATCCAGSAGTYRGGGGLPAAVRLAGTDAERRFLERRHGRMAAGVRRDPSV